jgi:hypothetical protein
MTPANYYVAVSGKDTNPGTATAPFATIQRARETVREKIKEGLTKDILVEIRGGTYPLTETLTFGPEDSGTEKHSVTYAAAPGAKVVLDGGRKIAGWKKGGSEIWTTEIPDVKAGKLYFRQLFINGQRAIRARTPNQGWCEGKPVQPVAQESTDQDIAIRINTSGGKGVFGWAREFEYEQARIEGGLAAWGNPGDIELVSLRHNEGGRKALQSIDPATQTVTLRPPHRWAPKCFGHDWFNGVPDGRCYLENALEFLDSPGEWYLDRKTGVLSYWPRPGEDLTRCDVVAPVMATTLLSVAGMRERPVVNLHFRGLHVEHADWPLPAHGYTALFCCNVPLFREGGDPGHRFIDAAVEITCARACSFRDGGVARVGGMGLVLGEGTADIAVEGNHIRQTGGGGIGLGQCNVGFGYTKAAPPPEPGEYERYRVCNNYVHHCGLDYYGAVGMALFRMKDSIVSHNLIHDTAYCGVTFAGDQDPKWAFVGNNTLERNHIYRDMRVTQDGGGLYSSFAHQGDVVRGNLFHDSGANPMSGGICLDKCTGVTFDHNVVYRNPVWTLVIFRRPDLVDNLWRHNLFMPTREPGLSSSKAKKLFDGRQGFELRPGNETYAPPDEFIEAMHGYAGLEPAYRKMLQGGDPTPCELHVLEDGITWQLDLPEQGWGVVYRLNVQVENGILPRLKASQAVGVKLRELDPAARYTLTAYAGPVRRTPTDSSSQDEGGDFRWGPLFPMVHEIDPAPDLRLPEAATGRELMEKGLTLKDGMIVIWVAYRRTVMKEKP